MDSRLDDRYIVIKRKSLEDWQKKALNSVLVASSILTVDCVVVEPDWAIYPQVVDMVLGERPVLSDYKRDVRDGFTGAKTKWRRASGLTSSPAPVNKLEIKVPYELKPLTAEQDRSLYDALKRLYRRDPVPEEIRRSTKVMKTRIADRVWLTNNLPFGTVFQYLGLTAMAVGIEFTGDGFDKKWMAELHVVSDGKLELLQYDVPQLRAILEPGYLQIEPQQS